MLCLPWYLKHVCNFAIRFFFYLTFRLVPSHRWEMPNDKRNGGGLVCCLFVFLETISYICLSDLFIFNIWFWMFSSISVLFFLYVRHLCLSKLPIFKWLETFSFFLIIYLRLPSQEFCVWTAMTSQPMVSLTYLWVVMTARWRSTATMMQTSQCLDITMYVLKLYFFKKYSLLFEGSESSDCWIR